MNLSAARQRLWWEIAIVLTISLIPSTLNAIFAFIELTLSNTLISESQTVLNHPASANQAMDVLTRSTRILISLAPVALVVWLMWDRHRSGFARLGYVRAWLRKDVGKGIVLAAAIGIPGLALYALSRISGVTVRVVSVTDEIHWTGALILVLASARAAFIEEVILLGYLSQRLTKLRWSPVWIIISVALLRGSYHLYQGVPMALGNVVMGVVFGFAFFMLLKRRVIALVIAHFVLDLVAFLGYPIAVSLLPEVF